ncbi:MAG: DNA gyrase inhibitor YacG [Caulobacteraceae bacterium]
MKVPACPVCGQPRDRNYRPFCSRRCSDIDLQKWMSGRYAIPAVADDDGETSVRGPDEGDA